MVFKNYKFWCFKHDLKCFRAFVAWNATFFDYVDIRFWDLFLIWILVQFAEMEIKLERVEAEKMDLKKTSNRLIKHVDSLKKDMDKFHKEAKAVSFHNTHQKKLALNIQRKTKIYHLNGKKNRNFIFLYFIEILFRL